MTSTATGQASEAAADRSSAPSRWGPRGLGPRLAGAAVSGALVALALPPYDVWVLAPLGVAGLVLLSRGQSARIGALLGLVHGLATFVPLLSWLTVIGPDAWLAVALLEASFLALAGAVTPAVLRLPAWPLWVACLWVAQELARDSMPFGGFPWGRLAFAETASPFTPYAAVGGAPLVTFVTALSGALIAQPVHGRVERIEQQAADDERHEDRLHVLQKDHDNRHGNQGQRELAAAPFDRCRFQWRGRIEAGLARSSGRPDVHGLLSDHRASESLYLWIHFL